MNTNENEQLIAGVYHRLYQALHAHKEGDISYQEMKRLWHNEKHLILRVVGQQPVPCHPDTQEFSVQ